jgi:hypothetical protein
VISQCTESRNSCPILNIGKEEPYDSDRRKRSKIRYNEYISETTLHASRVGLNRHRQDGAGKRANGDYVLYRRPNNSDLVDWIRSIDTAGSDGCKAAAPQETYADDFDGRK